MIDLSRYNTARDFLKLLAIITMTFDHISTFFMVEGSLAYFICQFFGNFTIVIMCFFIVEGLRYTRSVLNYSLRLLGWAMISEVPFYLLFGMKLDVLFTLLASLLIIYIIDRKGLPLGIAALMLFFPLSLTCDWSIIAPVFTIIFYCTWKYKKPMIAVILLPLSYFVFRLSLYSETTVQALLGSISILLVALLLTILRDRTDKQRKGIILGIVFYAYYPIHLALLYTIKIFIRNVS